MDFTNQLTIDQDASHVAVVTAGHTIHTVINIQHTTTTAMMLANIAKIPTVTGESRNTFKGMFIFLYDCLTSMFVKLKK